METNHQSPAPAGGVPDATVRELADLLVFGLDEPETINGEDVGPFLPLTLHQAAKFLSLRVKRARIIMTEPRFRQRYAANLVAFRDGERVRNIQTAISIRDTEGDKTAADQAVRLKAIASLEGAEGKPGVVVNVNSQTNVDARTISPGYVIRLPSKAEPGQASPDAIASRPAPPMIDVSPAQVPALIPAQRDD